jgi:hypothetical protein
VIEIEAVGDRLVVKAGPPHISEVWVSDAPLTPTEVLEDLSARGCHSTDITDAMDASGADWRPQHDAEVRRRRGSSG